MDLEQTIRACQKGDIEAQELLYKTYHKKMFAVCMYYSSSNAEAQDHIQEGFYHLFKKIGKYSFKGSFEGWMRRLFVNLILQSFRQKKHLYSISEELHVQDDLIYEHVIEDISAQDLVFIIQELSPQYKLVFNLYAIEGYSHKEIAEQLGISEGTSKSNLSRARLILQEKVLEKFPDLNLRRGNGR